MRYRKLRIAWSVVCGFAGVLMVVLWVRSYSWVTNFQSTYMGSRAFQYSFWRGGVLLRVHNLITQEAQDEWIGVFENYPKSTPQYDFWQSQSWPSFQLIVDAAGITIRFPYWFGLSAFAVVAVAPWHHWRFSLRTLLIATTLVAVVLGLVGWAARK